MCFTAFEVTEKVFVCLDCLLTKLCAWAKFVWKLQEKPAGICSLYCDHAASSHNDKSLTCINHKFVVCVIRHAWVLPCIEFVLAPIDRIQRRLLRELALTEDQALAIYSLAPLTSRRDMAMLGFLHRISFGCISNQIQVLFAFASPHAAGRIPTILLVRRNQRQFREPWFRIDVLKRSTFGVTVVYDLLPHI